MAMLILFVVCWFPCTKNLSDVAYKKYLNVPQVSNKVIFLK